MQIQIPAKNGVEKDVKMSTIKIVKSIIITAGILPAVFLSVSCQSIEDWFDRNKPEPEDNLTGTPQQNEVRTYTVEEAAALICNRLIMKFSMYYSGKPYLIVNANDFMAKKVALQLYKSNVANQWNAGANEKCQIRTIVDSNNKVWHVNVIDPNNRQVLLSLSLPLKKK
jgi:hypothetical protein